MAHTSLIVFRLGAFGSVLPSSTTCCFQVNTLGCMVQVRMHAGTYCAQELVFAASQTSSQKKIAAKEMRW